MSSVKRKIRRGTLLVEKNQYGEIILVPRERLFNNRSLSKGRKNYNLKKQFQC